MSNTNKPTIQNKPEDFANSDIAKHFNKGEPISAQQHHFLLSHEKALSSHGLDALLNYYLKQYHEKNPGEHDFLLPHEELNLANLKDQERRLRVALAQNKNPVLIKTKLQQLQQFRALTVNELILYHGNQFLTGAPFTSGGIPYTIYFQWGNLFGVAKYVVLSEEKSLDSNALIYFELMHERNLDQCVKDYQHHHVEEMVKLHEQQLTPAPVEQTAPAYQSAFSTPTLSLSKNKETREKNS